MLVERDQAEASGSERIAEHRVHAGAEPRRPPGLLREYQIAHLGLAQIGNRKLPPLLLLDGPEPVPVAFLVHHSKDQLTTLEQLLHRVGDEAAPLLLGPGKHAVAHPDRAPALFLEADSRLGRIALPALRDRPGIAAVVHVHHPKHRHLGNAAHLVERAARGAVDQPFIAHVAKQLLQSDLVVAGKPKRARDLALPRRRVRSFDEVEDLLSARKPGADRFTSHR